MNKPVNCRCDGEAIVIEVEYHSEMPYAQRVVCSKCGTRTDLWDTQAEAIEAWNMEMLGNVQECAKDARYTERTAKAIEHDASVTDTNGYKYHRTEYLCDGCKKKVLGGDNYCSHCGCRLIWRDDDE